MVDNGKGTGAIKMMPLFEVSFGTPKDGEVRINEMLPAEGFEVARTRATQIAEEHGWIVLGIIRSPWKVITEFADLA